MTYIKSYVKEPLKSNNDKKGINEKKKKTSPLLFGLVSSSEGRKQILMRESLTSL